MCHEKKKVHPIFKFDVNIIIESQYYYKEKAISFSMPVRIDKTIHHADEKFLLGTLRKPGEKPIYFMQKIDYRMHAERKPFLFLEIDEGANEYRLSWDTPLGPQGLYVPSFEFHDAVHNLLDSREEIEREGEGGTKVEEWVQVQEWGDRHFKKNYTLKEYFNAEPSLQHLLDHGFTKEGMLLIKTKLYALLLGHYERRKRITVFASEDLSDTLGPLVRATSQLPFTEKDDQRLTATITYLLNETFFERTQH